MFRCLPPTGTKMPLGVLSKAIINSLWRSGYVNKFEESICRYFELEYGFVVSSGRGALTLLFQAMRKMRPQKDEVILPAYTSFSVPAAVVKAGLKVSLYDVDPRTLTIDIKSLKKNTNSSTLCIVACHLYGYPCNIDAIVTLAKDSGVFLIDDAAQSMGAIYKEKYTGTFGDAGIFSLNRGKNITTMGGGIIVTDSEQIASALKRIMPKKERLVAGVIAILSMMILNMLLNPRFYCIANDLHFLNLGESIFSSEFSINKYTEFQACIGMRLLEMLNVINGDRISKANKIMSMLPMGRKVALIEEIEGAKSVFLRLPILCDKTFYKGCENMGIIRGYPLPLNEIEALRPHLSLNEDKFPGAKWLSEKIWTLPTHAYVTENDMDDIIELLETV